MGIKGIYHEIGPGERIALTKLAVETFEQKGRPLRLAVDISIWLFQIQSGKGGTNPALRTFYYRLLRLISHSIHPLFVFDGPNKPPFKRGKRTGPNVASIPEFLAKQLLKQFALPFHIAPGEAEAECALLQKEGIVDAVLSEDVDTLMFGSGLTLRNWSPEGSLKTKVFTHVNMYEAEKTKAGQSGLDREGMILVALMSGGDYVPEGIPGCGPKTACEAARAQFGQDLCRLSRNDIEGIAEWKRRLVHELRTNESKFFRSKHKALVIPDDFPRRDVLRYYTHPCVSSAEKLLSLRETLKWDLEIDVAGLRTFVGEAFDWVCISGAKKFIRNLAPALLVRELRLRGQNGNVVSDDICMVAQEEAQLIKTIHLKRQHVTTDGMTELRVGFIPINLVDIDLDAEEPELELSEDENESDEDDNVPDGDGGNAEESAVSQKKRVPMDYDPTTLEKIWILETFVKVGVPLKMQDWEESFRNATKYLAMKSRTKRTEKILKGSTNGGMQAGALDRFTRVSKPGIDAGSNGITKEDVILPISRMQIPPRPEIIPVQSRQLENSNRQVVPKPIFRMPPKISSIPSPSALTDVVELLSSPQSPQRKKRILRRSQSDTSTLTTSKVVDPPASIQCTPHDLHTETSASTELDSISELPPSVTLRRHRTPLRRTNTISTSSVQTRLSPTLSRNLTRPAFHHTQNPPHSADLAVNIQSNDRSLDVSSIAPSTPKKRPKPSSKTQQIITITSSPGSTTPRSQQKSIVDYLSPKTDFPSPTSKSAKSLTQLSSHAIDVHPLLDRPPEQPVFRIPLGHARNTTVNLREPSTLAETDSLKHMLPQPPPPPPQQQQHHRHHHQKPQSSSGRVIRLRESLAGAWAMDAGHLGDLGGDVETGSFLGPEAAASEVEVEESERKRKRDGKGKEKRKGKVREVTRPREWRVSQVEVLDLT